MTEERIVHSLDAIEPKDGAKSRMYQNIMEKAKQKKTSKAEQSGVIRMARLLVPIAACLCIALIGTLHFLPEQQPETKPPLLSNPIGGGTEGMSGKQIVAGAEEFQTLQITLEAPSEAENIIYSLLNQTTAQVEFQMGEHSYFVRASKQEGDVSGMFGEVTASESLEFAEDAVLYTIAAGETDTWKAVWSDGQCSYFLCNTDGAAKEDIKELCLAMIEVIGR